MVQLQLFGQYLVRLIYRCFHRIYWKTFKKQEQQNMNKQKLEKLLKVPVVFGGCLDLDFNHWSSVADSFAS